MRTVQSIILMTCLVLIPMSAAAFFDSGSDGSDGSFSPVANIVIDLTQADTGPGAGTYDSDLWAVVFNFTEVNIPVGLEVGFINHPSGAPVVWLVAGDATIEGSINLSGQPHSNPGVPGPGGFAGGSSAIRTRGFGPGGGGFPQSNRGSGASYGSLGQAVTGSTRFPTYGNEQIMPLIGGSGGAPAAGSVSGGAGGGAILIAASGTIVLNGSISANGGSAYSTGSFGSGAGSGGGIRLLGTTVNGTGSLSATGGSPGGIYGAYGGVGRIRVEAENLNLGGTANPALTYDLTPGPIFQDTTTPSVRVVTIDGQPVTADPEAGFSTVDHTMGASSAVEVGIEARNVPPGLTVTVHAVKAGTVQMAIASTPLSGSLALSTATATVDFATLENTEIYLEVDW